jgi:hypothetical protein
MGRYAYFSSGVHYKFWFGVQSSEDITRFYGEGDVIIDDDCGDSHIHRWEAQYDRERILKKLEKLRKENNCLPEVDWKKYNLNEEGTTALKLQLLPENDQEQLELKALYTLGCVIYHQLLYNEVLSCDYEI